MPVKVIFHFWHLFMGVLEDSLLETYSMVLARVQCLLLWSRFRKSSLSLTFASGIWFIPFAHRK